MSKLNQEELAKLLEDLHDQYNRQEFIYDDPVLIPHNFNKKPDIEVSGFLSALLAWGNRKAIQKAAFNLMELMDNAPSDFTSNHEQRDLKRFDKFVYRTMQPTDIKFIITALKHVYNNHCGLEALFTSSLMAGDTNMFNAIDKVRRVMVKVPHQKRSEKHLANPSSGSAAKRINLFLRWMVRADSRGVDFGLWKQIPTSKLVCPLDIHTGNSARELGLITRRANDKKSATELTVKLSLLDVNDPVKYDFALFGLSKKLKY